MIVVIQLSLTLTTSLNEFLFTALSIAFFPPGFENFLTIY